MAARYLRRQSFPMAGGKLLTRALFFLSPPLPHFRRLSTVSGAGGPESSVSVLHFLRSRGLGNDVIAKFASRQLQSKVGKKLPAKFDLLLTLGFSGPEAAKVLRDSDFLRTKSLISLQRRLDVLRTFVSDDADLQRIINRSVWTLSGSKIIHSSIVDNMSKLRGWGVSDAKINSFLLTHPRFFHVNPQRVDEAADLAEAEFGLRRDSKTFFYAVKALCESNWQSKFQVFESLGWERSGVIALFKSFPSCISIAEATLVEKVAFLINAVGLDLSGITKHPAMLGYSLEKRVRPRFELVNALKSKNLLPKSLAFYLTWRITEMEFMEKYVIKFMKQEPAICNAYMNIVASQR